MEAGVSPYRDDVDALKALLVKALQKADEAEHRAALVEAELVNAQALASATEAMIAYLKLQNAKLRREKYDASSERTERLLAQYELELEDLEDEIAARAAAAKTTTISAFERKNAGQEAVSRSPARTCRYRCAVLLPGLRQRLLDKYGQHQSLHRQAERLISEGVLLSVSTLADQIGAACVAFIPIHQLIEGQTFAAERLHGDDTIVPIMAKGKTITGQLWDYVRDDRPFGGSDPPSVVFYYSPDRRGDRPRGHLAAWSGVLQAAPMPGSRSCTLPIASQGSFWRKDALPMRAGSSSNRPTSRAPLARRAAARRRRSSTRSLWMPSKSSISCSRPSATSTARAGRAPRYPSATERATDGRSARMAQCATRPDLA